VSIFPAVILIFGSHPQKLVDWDLYLGSEAIRGFARYASYAIVVGPIALRAFLRGPTPRRRSYRGKNETLLIYKSLSRRQRQLGLFVGLAIALEAALAIENIVKHASIGADQVSGNAQGKKIS